MNCAFCKKKIMGNSISVTGRDFCSDICHLRFWKDEMPNLGGRWISDENLAELEYLNGQEREDEYNRIVNFIIDNFGITKFMLQLQYDKEFNELVRKENNQEK